MIFNDNYVEYHGISQVDGFQHGNFAAQPTTNWDWVRLGEVNIVRDILAKVEKKSENIAVYSKPEEKNHSSLGPVGFYFSIFFVGRFFSIYFCSN